MICRIAMFHFEDRQDESFDLTLLQKIAIVLENVLALKGIPCKEVEIETQVDSDADVSDCDY